jgi:hypothetical protein
VKVERIIKREVVAALSGMDTHETAEIEAKSESEQDGIYG